MATRGVIIFTLKLNENNGEFYPDNEKTVSTHGEMTRPRFTSSALEFYASIS